MTNPKNSLAILDIFLLILALLFTIAVIGVINYNLVDKNAIGKNIMFLTLSIWFTLFIFQFKALRKKTTFICWTIIALILLAMFFWLFNNPALNYLDKDGDKHNYSHGLISPILVLTLYQICRQISLKYFKVELGMLSRVSSYIVEEKRESNWPDIVCSIGFLFIPFAAFYF
ncbi:MAG TPA: hypothetical protein PLP23_09145 [Panacibacter sp.]|nr:hypothetical protein [Panacibacter sp.]